MFIITRLRAGFVSDTELEKNQDSSKVEKDGTHTLRNEEKPFSITEGTERKNNHMRRFILLMLDEKGLFVLGVSTSPIDLKLVI